MKTITIDGIEYAPVSEIPAPAPYRIVVIEGRWNVVGSFTATEDGSVVITEARVIRYWGTTRGLGELALNGPTAKTLLDESGTVRVPASAVLLTLDTEASLWS